jgi:nucleoside phosphorylase
MKIKADTLLVTVTPVETRAVFDASQAATGRVAALKMDPGLPCHDLGEVSGSRVVLVQSEMGTSGPGGSLLTVSEAIRALEPVEVIMTGIAFGMDPSRQAISDILVSENLRPYELQRVGTAAGQPRIILRSDRPHAATGLLRRFKAAQYSWTGAKLRFGLVLSGEKLVDNLAFREELRALEPEALGGEMEGAGLYAACQDAKVDWILVKAICDWADGQKENDRAARQKLAADNAARFVLHVLQQTPVRREKKTKSGGADSGGRVVASGERSVAAKEIRSSIIVTGDGNTVSSGQDEGRERENRWRAFRAYVFSLRSSFDDVEDRKLVEAHAQSRSGVRVEAAKVREDISSDKRGAFDNAVSAYCVLTREDIECRDRPQVIPASKDKFGNYSPGGVLAWQPKAHYELGRERIKKLLDKLLEYAE